jgi:hypothetical protein
MSHDLARIEHVHVDVHVDLVRELAEAIHLLGDCRRVLPQIVNADVLDERVIEHPLLERIGEADAAHHDMPLRQRRVQTGIEPHARQAPPRGDRHRHAAERSAPRRFRSIEIGMRVQPEHAYPQRPERLAGVLQSGDHARHRWTCSKQPDRKVTVTHRLRDRASQVPERKPETLPAAVLRLLFRRQADLDDAHGGAELLEHRLDPSIRHRRRAVGCAVRDERLFEERDLEPGAARVLKSR